jgi:hypothetical protein
MMSRTFLSNAAGPTIAAACLLLLVFVLGKPIPPAVNSRPSFLSAIDCEPPPGLQKLEFLQEVWYLAGYPFDFPSAEELNTTNYRDQIEKAILKHRQVSAIEALMFNRPGQPEDLRIVMRLKFR